MVAHNNKNSKIKNLQQNEIENSQEKQNLTANKKLKTN